MSTKYRPDHFSSSTDSLADSEVAEAVELEAAEALSEGAAVSDRWLPEGFFEFQQTVMGICYIPVSVDGSSATVSRAKINVISSSDVVLELQDNQYEIGISLDDFRGLIEGCNQIASIASIEELHSKGVPYLINTANCPVLVARRGSAKNQVLQGTITRGMEISGRLTALLTPELLGNAITRAAAGLEPSAQASRGAEASSNQRSDHTKDEPSDVELTSGVGVEQVGQWLKGVRLSQRKSQRETAGAVGASKSALSRIEAGRGKNGPTIGYLTRILNSMNMNIDVSLSETALIVTARRSEVPETSADDLGPLGMVLGSAAGRSAIAERRAIRSIGSCLRQARGDRSLKELAKKAGTTESVLSRIERGLLYRGPTIGLVKRIVAAGGRQLEFKL